MTVAAEPDRPTSRPPAWWALLLAFVFVAVLGASAIALERPTGQAAGQVLAAGSHKPLAGARVTVTGPVTRHLFTGPDGRFRFSNLPVGSYYISAKQRRFDPQFQEGAVEVVEGKGVENLTFELARTVPDLSVTNQQRVFTPAEPVRILVRGTNAPAMDVSLYRLDLEKAMAIDPELKLLHHPDVERLRADGLIQPVKSWRQPVPREAIGDDDWFFKPVQVDARAEGAYVVGLSARPEATPDDDAPPPLLKTAYWFNVTRLALVTKRSADQLVVYGADLVAKKPLAGARLAVFDKKHRVGEGVTGADGIARLSAPGEGESFWVLGFAGDSPAYVSAGFTSDRSAYRIYAFTERPVYRPGQRVNYKGIVRAQAGAHYQLAAGQSVSVEIKDGTGARVDSRKFTLSSWSSFDGSLELAADAPLGEYDMDLQMGDSYESIHFKVADYRKPEYKVELTPDKPRYIQGGHATVHLLSSYYFGAPVPNAKLAVTVYAAPAYGEHDPDEDFYSGFTGEDTEPVWGFGDVVQQVEGVTDAQGKFDLDVPLVAQTRTDDEWVGDRTFTVAVEAMDASGRPVKAHKSFLVTQGQFKLQAETDNYLYVEHRPIRVSLKATDYDGKPTTTDVRVEVVRMVSKQQTDKEGNDVWETRRVPAWSGTAKTDGNGLAALAVPPQAAGDYEIDATATDGRGNKIQAFTGAWVASSGEALGAEASSSSGALKVVLDRKVYKPGQVARALVVSPVPNVTALVTVEGVSLHQAQTITLHGTTGLISVPVTRDFEPNAFVAACVVNGKEFLEASRSLNVTPAEKFLQVTVTSDKARYQPGDQATYTVEARDYNGRPVQAEVSLGVVDQAIYAIEPDNTADIRYFFHGPRWNDVRTSYSFAEEYSGGLDKFAPDPRVRAKFEDTAGWFPALHTGPDGTARVTLTLPDNLTTWVATAHAATADAGPDDTRVGSASATAVATKDLLVRLETPRFVVAGDHLLISAIAHSYLDQPQQVQLRLELEGLQTTQPLTQLAVLAPGDAKRVTWDVDVPAAGTVKARVYAKSERAADAMELSFEAESPGTPGFQAYAGTADATKPGYASVDVPAGLVPGSAHLTFQPNVTPLPAILGAIDYLHRYEYGCVEQTMTRFLPDVAVKPRLDAAGAAYGDRFASQDDRIKDGVRRLIGMQHGDGGWGWWEHDETQVEMTAYVLYGLAEARDAHYAVPMDHVRKGIDNLQRALSRIRKDVFTRDSVRRGAGADGRAFAILALSRWDRVPAAELDRLWGDRMDLSTFGLAQATLALSNLNDERRYQAWALLTRMADQSETQAHWNANAQEFAWEDNTTEATAYALTAALAIAPDDPIIPRTVRWLTSRNARGYWDSTKDTGAAAIALASYMQARHPAAAPEATVVVSLDGQELARFGAGTASPLEDPTPRELPTSALTPGRHQLTFTETGTDPVDFSGGFAYLERVQGTAPSPANGLTVSRDYFLLPASVYAKAKGQGTFGDFYDEKVVARLQRLGGSVKSGERVLVRVSISTDRALRYMALEDPLPAGCEILEDQPTSWSYWWDHQEYRDDRAAFFFNSLPKGARTMYYVMRPTTPGRFHVLPTTAWAMYAPDVRARGAGSELVITE